MQHVKFSGHSSELSVLINFADSSKSLSQRYGDGKASLGPSFSSVLTSVYFFNIFDCSTVKALNAIS